MNVRELRCAGVLTWLALFVPLQIGALETDQPKADFLFIGSYHMNNHALDLANLAADDVLSPARQQEIAAVVRLLENYRPTKVMIEVPQEKQKDIDRDLAASCKGERSLSREEYDQIGLARVTELVRDDQRVLKTGTVLDMLNHLNSPAWLSQNAAIYQHLGLLGTRDDPAGANWLQYWFGRNLMIFNSIVRETHDGDRVLVIFGAGHGNHLRQFARDSRTYRVHDFPQSLAKADATK